MSESAKEFMVAAIQTSSPADKDSILSRVAAKVAEAARLGAKVVVLPEYFTCPRGLSDIRECAEALNGSSRTQNIISSLAESHGIYIIAGTVPEIDNGIYYNTCGLYDRSGNLVGKYRKKYRLNILGELVRGDMQVTADGNEPMIFRTEFVDIGVGTGNDIHLPQLALAYASAGRAIDSLSYVVLCSPGPSEEEVTGRTIGCSTIVDPWGVCLKSADGDDEVICERFCPETVRNARKCIPILESRREDIYKKSFEIRPTIVGNV